MPALETGRVCLKTRGRKAGERVVVVELADKNFAVVDGPTQKRKKCNVRHLFPTEETLKITKSTSHEEIAKLMKK